MNVACSAADSSHDPVVLKSEGVDALPSPSPSPPRDLNSSTFPTQRKHFLWDKLGDFSDKTAQVEMSSGRVEAPAGAVIVVAAERATERYAGEAAALGAAV